ncbi:MAG TPA: ABC transporter substrate-binding protein [Magnetospirillaceae bacterium]|jgi:ABC-type branched-subunit amino acid transport system substrate-binding protein
MGKLAGISRRGAVCAAFMVGLGLAASAMTARADGDHVRVAMNLPLTGPIAVVTIPYRDGLLMGFDDAAKAYNVPRDAFVTDIQDNAGEAKQAISVLQKQMLEPFDVYISGVSPQTRAVAPEIDKKKVPHILYAFDTAFVQGDPNRVRILPNFRLQQPLYVNYAKAKGAKRVAAIHLNIASQQEFYGQFLVPELKKDGIEVMREAYDIGTKDYSTLGLKIAEFKPDLVIVDGFSFNLLPMIAALRTLDLVHDGRVLVGMDFIDLLYNKTPADQIKGVVFASPTVELPEGKARAADWIEKFKARFKEEPSWPGAYGYDTARVIAAAFAKNHKVTTASIHDVMPFDGLVGKINLDKDNDIDSTMALGLVEDSGAVKTLK